MKTSSPRPLWLILCAIVVVSGWLLVSLASAQSPLWGPSGWYAGNTSTSPDYAAFGPSGPQASVHTSAIYMGDYVYSIGEAANITGVEITFRTGMDGEAECVLPTSIDIQYHHASSATWVSVGNFEGASGVYSATFASVYGNAIHINTQGFSIHCAVSAAVYYTFPPPPTPTPGGSAGDDNPCAIYVSPVVSGTATPGPTPTIIGPLWATPTPTPTPVATYAPPTPISYTPFVTITNYLCNSGFEDGLNFWTASGTITVERKVEDENDHAAVMVGDVILYQYPTGGVIPPNATFSFWAYGASTIAGQFTAGLGENVETVCIFPTTPKLLQWTQYNCDLSNFAGRHEPVAIKFNGGWLGQRLYVDEVRLESENARPDLKPGKNEDNYIGFNYVGYWNVAYGGADWTAPISVRQTVQRDAYVDFSTFNMECMKIGYTTDPAFGKLQLINTTLTPTLSIPLTITQSSITHTLGVETRYCPTVTTGRQKWRLLNITGQNVMLDYIFVEGSYGVLGPGTYDDTESRIGYYNSTESGGQVIGIGGWEQITHTAAYQGSYHRAKSNYTYAVFAVEGVTCLQLYYITDSANGKLDVYIDDVFDQRIDQWNAPTQQRSWTRCGLTDDLHVVKIRPSGERSDTATDWWVTFDKLVLTTDPGYYLNLGINDDAYVGFNYASEWTTPGGNYYGRAAHEANDVPAGDTSAKVTFRIRNAECFNYVYETRPDLGIAKVYVDGSLATTIDQYSATGVYDPQVTRYQHCGLNRLTKHTVIVQAAGQKNAASTHYDILLDYVEVFNEGEASSLIDGKVDDTYTGLVWNDQWRWYAKDGVAGAYQETEHVSLVSGAALNFQTRKGCVVVGLLSTTTGHARLATSAISETIDLRGGVFEYHLCQQNPYVDTQWPYSVTLTVLDGQARVDYVEALTYEKGMLTTSKFNDNVNWLVWHGAWTVRRDSAHFEGDEHVSNPYNPAWMSWMSSNSCIALYYDAGPGRGQMTLTADTEPIAILDQYAASTAYQFKNTQCGANDKFHLWELRASGRNANSSSNQVAVDALKLGDETDIWDDGDGGAFNDCVQPTSWLDVGKWVNWVWCQASAFVSWNDYNTEKLMAFGAYLQAQEPFGTVGEARRTFEDFRGLWANYNWTDSGHNQQVSTAIWASPTGILNGDFALRPATISATCDLHLGWMLGPSLGQGVCAFYNVMNTYSILAWVQLIWNAVLVWLVIRYFIKNWVAKATNA